MTDFDDYLVGLQGRAREFGESRRAVADAHASDDCAVDCPHPDHLYVGDDDFWDLRTLMDLRELAQRNSWHLSDVLNRLSDPEGPVIL